MPNQTENWSIVDLSGKTREEHFCVMFGTADQVYRQAENHWGLAKIRASLPALCTSNCESIHADI